MPRRATIVASIAGGVAAVATGALAVAARRERCSMPLLIARSLLGMVPGSLDDVPALRARIAGRTYPREAPLPRRLARQCRVERWAAHGQAAVTLTPVSGHSDLHILYLHGGAFINPTVAAHWSIVGALIDATGAQVTVPFYALSPEHDHRPGTALVDAAYRRIVTTQPTARIVVAGDSAGGNLALSLAIRRRDAGLSLPDRVILFSPWLDLTLRDERARALEADDVMLAVDGLRECGRWWAGATEPATPSMSPLYADPAGLPPIMMFQGDRDIFVVDARTFAARAGGRCFYREYPGAFHVFMGATFTPEAKDVFRQIRTALRR